MIMFLWSNIALNFEFYFPLFRICLSTISGCHRDISSQLFKSALLNTPTPAAVSSAIRENTTPLVYLFINSGGLIPAQFPFNVHL
jgi:hypothetical protein